MRISCRQGGGITTKIAPEVTILQEEELLVAEGAPMTRIRITTETETETTVIDLAEIGTTNNEVPITTTGDADRGARTTEWIDSWMLSSACQATQPENQLWKRAWPRLR